MRSNRPSKHRGVDRRANRSLIADLVVAWVRKPRDPRDLLLSVVLPLAFIGAVICYTVLHSAARNDLREHGAVTTGQFKHVVTVHSYKSRDMDHAWYSYEVDGKRYSVRDTEEVRSVDEHRSFPDRLVYYWPHDPRTAVVGEWATNH